MVGAGDHGAGAAGRYNLHGAEHGLDAVEQAQRVGRQARPRHAGPVVAMTAASTMGDGMRGAMVMVGMMGGMPCSVPMGGMFTRQNRRGTCGKKCKRRTNSQRIR
jgi:hypothetical protein